MTLGLVGGHAVLAGGLALDLGKHIKPANGRLRLGDGARFGGRGSLAGRCSHQSVPLSDDQLAAGGFAGATGQGTHAAMLMMVGMALALDGARFTECGAGRQLLLDEIGGGGGLSAQDASGGGTNRSAIQVEPNTAHQALKLGLAQAGIGAGGAGLLTQQTRFQAGSEIIRVNTHRLGMGFQHLVDGVHSFSLAGER
jgi:hypothetical protein